MRKSQSDLFEGRADVHRRSDGSAKVAATMDHMQAVMCHVVVGLAELGKPILTHLALA